MSILNQNYEQFELFIIDDCSTDGTIEAINFINDHRITIIKKPTNTGLTHSLNIGIELAKGKYIARMDGDDISLLDRFEKQINYMESNPDIIICGGGYEIINSDNKYQPSLSNGELLFEMIDHCPFVHPAIMMRRDILERYNVKYDPAYEPAEDYKMWIELSKYGKIANIPEILIKYRVHENQTSNKRVKQQMEIANKIALSQVKRLSNSNTYSEYYINRIVESISDLKKYKSVQVDIKEFFEKNRIKIHSKYLSSRARLYYIEVLSKDNFSIPMFFKRLPILINIVNILGFLFIIKYIIKSFIYWKSVKTSK
jgi:glycosyltransferase involved in cell wall biosynthesis